MLAQAPSVETVGVVALGTLFLLKEVFSFVRSMQAKRNGHAPSPLAMQVRDLHEWHKPDDRGRQTWKVDVDELLNEMRLLRQTVAENTEAQRREP